MTIISEDNYGPSAWGPTIDSYLDPAAIARVVNDDDHRALQHLADEVETAVIRGKIDVELTAFKSRTRLKGIIEWWCRNEYGDIDY